MKIRANGLDIEVDDQGRRIVYCNIDDAVLRYTARVHDTRRYSQLFIEALAWKLASMLAGPMLRGEVGAAEAKRCLIMAEAMMGKADVADGNQRSVEPKHVAAWIAARRR